jgi:hypothetical protein
MLGDFLKKHVLADPKPGAAPEGRPPVAGVVGPAAAMPAATGLPLPPVGVNQAMVDAIKKSLFARPSALTDLLAAADKLSGIIADTPTRIKSAFAMSSGGRTAQQVLDSLTVHLNDVDGEERRFQAALDGTRQAETGALTQQANDLLRHNETCAAEIAAAQQRVAQLQEQMGRQAAQAAELQAQAAAKSAELDRRAAEFRQAADAVRAELQQHRATISTTLATP